MKRQDIRGLCPDCKERFIQDGPNIFKVQPNQYTQTYPYKGLQLTHTEWQIVNALRRHGVVKSDLLVLAIWGNTIHDYNHALRQRVYILNRPDRLPSVGQKIVHLSGEGYTLQEVENG